METKTLTEIAASAGVTVTSVHKWVTTKQRPNWKRAKQLARITGTDPILWLEGTKTEIRMALRSGEVVV